VLIQQACQFGECLGRIQLTVQGGQVTFDMADTQVLDVNDTIVSDPTYASSIDTAIDALERHTSGASFLETALGHVTGMTVPDNASTRGDLYFYSLGNTAFDVLGQQDLKETPLLVLSADAMVKSVESLGLAVDVAVQARGVIRADLNQGKTGVLGFGDVFRAL